MTDRRQATIERVRELLSGHEVRETSLVGGGLGFMVDGNLCCGVSERGLTVRVGKDARDAALAEPHVGPLMVGKRRPSAFVVVEPAGYEYDDEALQTWVGRGLAFVATLG